MARKKKRPSTKYALKREKKYLVGTPAEASASKSRATTQYRAGKLKKSAFNKIHKAANRILRRKARIRIRKNKKAKRR